MSDFEEIVSNHPPSPYGYGAIATAKLSEAGIRALEKSFIFLFGFAWFDTFALMYSFSGLIYKHQILEA